MDSSKRNFLRKVGFAGAAGLAVATAASAKADEVKAGALSTSVFNVMDFGAKADGKTPDSEAIQKALDAAKDVHGTVYFPSGRYLCHDLKVHQHTTLLSDAQWGYRGNSGAMLILDSEEANCVLDITGAFGVHIRGLQIMGLRGAKKEIHGIFLNNDKEFSKKEDTVVIDDCKIQSFSGHGVYLLRIWLFVIRHSIMQSNARCGCMIYGWDGFVLDNQFSGNAEHGFSAEKTGSTVMFTANRVEWNGKYGFHLPCGNTWNVVGNCFDCNGWAGVCAKKTVTSSFTGNVFRRSGKNLSAENTEDISSQMILEGCSGLTVVANSFAARKNTDRGKGRIVPEYGFYLKKLSYCVITDNVLFNGFTNAMVLDAGEHGKELVMADNVGCKHPTK